MFVSVCLCVSLSVSHHAYLSTFSTASVSICPFPFGCLSVRHFSLFYKTVRTVRCCSRGGGEGGEEERGGEERSREERGGVEQSGEERRTEEGRGEERRGEERKVKERRGKMRKG